MRAISLPEVAYGATAVRPDWGDLPAALREAIGARLGAPVAAAASAGGGFTRAFAAVLTTAAGDRAFVKAAPLTEPLADWYAREAADHSRPAAGGSGRPAAVDAGGRADISCCAWTRSRAACPRCPGRPPTWPRRCRVGRRRRRR